MGEPFRSTCLEESRESFVNCTKHPPVVRTDHQATVENRVESRIRRKGTDRDKKMACLRPVLDFSGLFEFRSDFAFLLDLVGWLR